MDIIKLQFKTGTIVRDTDTGELLVISHYIDNKVYFSDFYGNAEGHDYIGFLGKVYVKDKTAQVLYGKKKA